MTLNQEDIKQLVDDTIKETNIQEGRLAYLEIDEFLIYDASTQYYEIIIQGKKITLNEEDILSSKKFRQKYFAVFGVMIPNVKQENWCKLMTEWRRAGRVIKEKIEEYDEDKRIVEIILDYIANCKPLSNKLDGSRNGFCYFNEGVVFISSEQIERIILKNQLKINLTKLSFILKDYLVSGTKVIKLENGRVTRFWAFKNLFDFINPLEFKEEVDKDDNVLSNLPK